MPVSSTMPSTVTSNDASTQDPFVPSTRSQGDPFSFEARNTGKKDNIQSKEAPESSEGLDTDISSLSLGFSSQESINSNSLSKSCFTSVNSGNRSRSGDLNGPMPIGHQLFGSSGSDFGNLGGPPKEKAALSIDPLKESFSMVPSGSGFVDPVGERNLARFDSNVDVFQSIVPAPVATPGQELKHQYQPPPLLPPPPPLPPPVVERRDPFSNLL